jgi:hypothetical protein
MTARVANGRLVRVSFTLAESFDAGAAAYGGKWPQSANPFPVALWPDSAWAWELGWRYAAYCDASERRGR